MLKAYVFCIKYFVRMKMCEGVTRLCYLSPHEEMSFLTLFGNNNICTRAIS